MKGPEEIFGFSLALSARFFLLILSFKLSIFIYNLFYLHIFISHCWIAAVKFIEPKRPEQGKQLLVACAGDRGLCGAINSSVSKPVKAAIRKSPESTLVAVVGDKPKAQLAREGRNNFVYTFGAIGKATPSFAEASSVAELIMSSKIEFAEASILYNRFKSVIMYELDTFKSYPASAITNAGNSNLYF